ncbi:MAG TPA: hypothetical protein IGR64_10040 [Leptolyngbyaceae cyanobacterium M65_K2018_010]|nr:hypothetical protein [Leptolyngbyaceae cyanobacterium M65_K2018_010]
MERRLKPVRWATGNLVVGLGLLLLTGCDPAPRANPTPTQPLNPAEIRPGEPDRAAPPPPPAGAFLAQLSPEQTRQLTSLGVEVVVPGVVPPTFSVAELRIDQSETAVAYMIVYRDGANRCFATEFATEGVTEPPVTQNRRPIQPPLFPGRTYGLNYGEFQDSALRSQFPGSNLYTDWLMGRSGAYRLIGSALIGELFPALKGCQDLAPDQAVSLVESFTLLTTEPMGASF